MPLNLSVVIPVYNEERNVAEAVRRVQAYFAAKPIEGELIIVSDGSTDKTNAIMQDLVKSQAMGSLLFLCLEKNTGKGAAARKGVLASRAQYVLVTDADLSTPIKEIDKLIRALEEGNDIAIGSRALRSPGCDVQQSFKRRISGRIFNTFVQLIVLRGFRDTQCGFKCFKSAIAKKLFTDQKLDGFSFDVEVLFLAKKHGYKICEVPVMWMQAPDSRVRFVRDSFRMVRDLFRIRQLHH